MLSIVLLISGDDELFIAYLVVVGESCSNIVDRTW